MSEQNEERGIFFDQPITDEDVISIFTSIHRWLTYREIATRLHRKKTPSLVARVKSLAERGILEYRFKRLPNGVDMHQFRPRIDNPDNTR